MRDYFFIKISSLVFRDNPNLGDGNLIMALAVSAILHTFRDNPNLGDGNLFHLIQDYYYLLMFQR